MTIQKQVDIFLRKSTCIKFNDQKPNKPGIYAICCDQDFIYVGQSKDIGKRWKNHEKTAHIELLENLGHKIEFYYLTIENHLLNLQPEILTDIETNLIKALNPLLNSVKPKPRDKQVEPSTQPSTQNEQNQKYKISLRIDGNLLDKFNQKAQELETTKANLLEYCIESYFNDQDLKTENEKLKAKIQQIQKIL